MSVISKYESSNKIMLTPPPLFPLVTWYGHISAVHAWVKRQRSHKTVITKKTLKYYVYSSYESNRIKQKKKNTTLSEMWYLKNKICLRDFVCKILNQADSSIVIMCEFMCDPCLFHFLWCVTVPILSLCVSSCVTHAGFIFLDV